MKKLYINTKTRFQLLKLRKWTKRYLKEDLSSEQLQEIKKHVSNNKLNKEQIIKYFNTLNDKNLYQRKQFWDHYLENTLAQKQNSIELKISTTPSITAVIVESRKHLHFKVVVENMISNLQHLSVGLNIYHGTENEEFVKNCLKKHKNINFININIPNLDIEAYNEIMLSKKFHERITTDRYLVFQTDTITFKTLDKKFLEYDYIGAPWKKELHSKYGAEVGNGGLSIRSKKAMLNIIEQNIPRELLHPEDLYLAQILKKQNFNVAPYEIALNFATEAIFNEKSFGCHKSWELIKFTELKQLLSD
jgi:hypothetical protein